MVTWMLDTNILIYCLKNRPPSVATRIDALDEDDLLRMSFVTYAELLEGAERSSRKSEVLDRLAALTRSIGVAYQRSSAISEHYAVQATALKASGTPIGNNDLWIACHALAENATLVTNNVRDIGRVKGLSLENRAA